MDISGSFNTAAGGDASAGGGHSNSASSSSSGAQHAADSQAVTPQSAESASSEHATVTGHVEGSPETSSPGPATLNAIQDRHFDEIGRFHTERYHARERMLADFDRRFGERERQLQREIDERQELLNNSGPARLLWLKLTRQIPKDPQRDLDAKRNEWERIQSDREAANWNFDREREEQLQAVRERHLAERQSPAPEPSRQGISSKFNQAARERNAPAVKSTSDAKRELADPLRERLEALEAQRARPELDHDMPAPKNEATWVNKRVEEHLAIEISKLKAKLEGEQEAEEEAELDEDY